MSTGDSDEDMDRESQVITPGTSPSKTAHNRPPPSYVADNGAPASNGRSGGGGGGKAQDLPDGRSRDRSCSLRPALYSSTAGNDGGGGSQHISLEAVNSMAKSVSTPHIPRAAAAAGTENGMNVQGNREEYLVNTFGKSP